jgi:hypothetical protein
MLTLPLLSHMELSDVFGGEGLQETMVNVNEHVNNEVEHNESLQTCW